MKPGLKQGQSHEFWIQVRDDMRAQFEETVIHPLYATAAMINHMEWASRQLILPYLEEDEEGVGYQINVKHLHPAPVGTMIRICAVVRETSSKRVITTVEAWHETTRIGQGEITQAITDVKALYARARQNPAPPENNQPFAPMKKCIAEALPTPAALLSLDGAKALRLEIIRWETAFSPCSRYDEWLVIGVELMKGGQSICQEGPFLLRYEIEDWLTAIQLLLEGKLQEFKSDFLEPDLWTHIQKAGSGWTCQFRVNLLKTENLPAERSSQAEVMSQRLTFETTTQALQNFAQGLSVQLEGFASRL